MPKNEPSGFPGISWNPLSTLLLNSRSLGPEERTDLLKRQLPYRSCRKRSEEEFKALAMWVRRDPGSIAREDYGGVFLYLTITHRAALLTTVIAMGKILGKRWLTVVSVLASTLGS
jgi:hypothetical protein